jgi:zinc protease
VLFRSLISLLEKHGVAFGDNINAYTGQDETVYNLSDIPVEPPGLIDTCLLAMFDWSQFVSLTEKEIEAEKPVITEEWRTRRNAGFRLSKQFLTVLFKGSKYAERDVIGDLEVIKNFSNNTLWQFYTDWHRTDLQAIAVVGDVDVKDIERKIRKLFSQLKRVDSPLPRPVFDIPAHKETLYVLATDKEAVQSTVDIYIIHRAADPLKKNLGYMREQLLIRLMNNMMNIRISDLLQKGTPPFISGSVEYSEIVRGYNAFNISAVARPGEDNRALAAIYTEAERTRRSGFTTGELERVKASLMTSYDNIYKQKDKIPNDKYINEIENYFLTNEPLPSLDYEYDFVKNTIPTVTSDEISSLYKVLMAEDNRVIVITGPEDRNIKHLSEAEARETIIKVKSSEISSYQDVNTDQPLISDNLPGSKVIRTNNLKQFDAVEWTLGNNARVVYKKVDYEKDNIILSAFSPGGTSLYNQDMLPSATMLPAIIGTYGIGDFENVTFQKMMSGKKATANINLGELTEGISGSSTPEDFETMMQLLYLRFEKPRFDREAHDAIMSRYESYVANMSKDPSKIMQDSVSLWLTNYNPRTMIMNNEFLRLVEFEKIRKVYNERFRNASDFVFLIV